MHTAGRIHPKLLVWFEGWGKPVCTARWHHLTSKWLPFVFALGMCIKLSGVIIMNHFESTFNSCTTDDGILNWADHMLLGRVEISKVPHFSGNCWNDCVAEPSLFPFLLFPLNYVTVPAEVSRVVKWWDGWHFDVTHTLAYIVRCGLLACLLETPDIIFIISFILRVLIMFPTKALEGLNGKMRISNQSGRAK